MTYKNAVPVVAATDVRAGVDYYAQVLGFTEHFIFGDPPVYAGVKREGVLLYISLDVTLVEILKSNKLHPDLFIWVQDIDKAYAEHQTLGAKLVEEISDRPWDARQYVIEDPSGYHLKIAEPLDEIA